MKKFLQKYEFDRADLLYLFAITVIGLAVRLILRVVTTVDWEMYWDPWISDLKEMGFAYLATDVYDYTPPFMYILWVISKLPINPMTAYKGLHIAIDFLAAAVMGHIVLQETKSKVKAVCSYGLMLMLPTIWANSALWAQCDILFMTFLLLFFYYLFQDRPCLAMFFYGMAFIFKLQTLFIFPFLILLWVNKKVKLSHFLWLPVLYFISIVPAWIAGRPLGELIGIYMAQGAQDVWCLSLKWPNIYMLIGNLDFLLEYADAGTWLILGMLMCIMFAMAQKKFRITNRFMVQMALFFALLCPYILPHMHERYGCVADILAFIYAMMNVKRFYIFLLQILISFNSYMAYLSHLGFKDPAIPYGLWALLELGLIVAVGLDLWNYMKDPKNRISEECSGKIQAEETFRKEAL